ncbi:hypothetical protein Acr_00g0089110 [Actinidia rufa]|uniref:Reverse transcriptase Ty1/copia-type domain-containing protein n=1 Tax=Actinidia rufa TaxID=165716 RepID=A0A7J0DXR9_9ERIC|nr:hypothetical protein Acr_00g0089110 [Actinidia rufa]
MQRFLRARKLWKYITGDAQPPHFSETDEDDDDLHAQYQSQLEDWDRVNSKIITWFSNTFVSSIHSLFTPFETAKEAPLPPPSQFVRFTSSKNIPSGSQKKYCSFCRRDTHSYEDCRSRALKSRCKGYHNRQTAAVTDSTGPSPDSSSSSTLTAADVETIVTQVLSRTNIHSSALSTTSEHKLRHILHTIRVLLISASVTESFWEEAALIAVYTINRTPSLVTDNISPYERYGIEHKGYRCYDPISKRLRISRHVEFWEDVKFSDISKTLTPSGLGRPIFIDPSLDIILPVTSSPSTGSLPSPSLTSRTMDVPNACPPTAPPSVSCPPTRWSTRLGVSSSPFDSALFLKKSTKGIVLLLLYVDNMIITGDDLDGIETLKQFLSLQFQMKDLGNLSYFLGIEVSSTSDGYYLSQTKYDSDLLSRVGLTDNKTVDTPLENNVRLNTTDGEPLSDPTLYCQLVGSLIYLTVTQPALSCCAY